MTRAAARRRAALLAAAVAVSACQVARRPGPESVAALRVADVRRLAARRAQSPPAWSPDSRAVAYAGDGALWLAGLDGRERRLAAAGLVTDLAWSPASGAIAYIDRGQVYVLAEGGAPRPIRLDGFATRLAWDPAGGRLAVVVLRGSGAGRRAELWVTGVTGGFVRRLAAGAIVDPQWFADGLYLFYGELAGTGEVSRWSKVRVRGPDARAAPAPLAGVRQAVLSPGGRQVAVIAGAGDAARIYIVSAEGAGVRTATPPGAYSGLSWAPQGDKIAYAARLDDANAELWIADATGDERAVVHHYQVEFPDPALALVIAWSPDGRRLAFSTTAGRLAGPVWVAAFTRR